MITLTIKKSVINPKFDEEYKEYKEATKYGRYGDFPTPKAEFEQGCLTVEISEEQFEAIRKAVIDKF